MAGRIGTFGDAGGIFRFEGHECDKDRRPVCAYRVRSPDILTGYQIRRIPLSEDGAAGCVAMAASGILGQGTVRDKEGRTSHGGDRAGPGHRERRYRVRGCTHRAYGRISKRPRREICKRTAICEAIGTPAAGIFTAHPLVLYRESRKYREW